MAKVNAMTKDREVVETTVRVRYAETDAMGVVYHTNYLIWFEVGAASICVRKGATTPTLKPRVSICPFRRWTPVS